MLSSSICRWAYRPYNMTYCIGCPVHTVAILLQLVACLLSKNNWVSKSYDQQWIMLFLYYVLLLSCCGKIKFLLLLSSSSSVFIAFCTYYISALSCHTTSRRAQKCWKQDQKYKTKSPRLKTKTKAARPRPKPRPVWDRSCHKTAVSDPKTAKWEKVNQSVDEMGYCRVYFCLKPIACRSETDWIRFPIQGIWFDLRSNAELTSNNTVSFWRGEEEACLSGLINWNMEMF